MAGHYRSVSEVNGSSLELEKAIETVAASLNRKNTKDQIFIQPMVRQIRLNGVAVTRDPNTGGHYFVINYDDHSQQTNSVTGGQGMRLKTYYYDKTCNLKPKPLMAPIVNLLRKLEAWFKTDSIDVEFSVDKKGILYLLQVRPFPSVHKNGLNKTRHREILDQIEKKIRLSSRPHPYLCGSKTVFGVMPDWNPAEMIGIRPRPLALSLYKELITDNIWAYQRDNYGYKNLRSFPLLIHFSGMPYIDVRVSFNSFIPNDIDKRLADKLVTYYISCLEKSPNFHDKVEFEIVFSCYTFDLKRRLEALPRKRFSARDKQVILESLRRLTNRIMEEKNGLWEKDVAKIKELERRQEHIRNSRLDAAEKIYWLLEDCKRYGTLPFAGLARGAFVAVQFLKSMVSEKILSPRDYQNFMNSLNTVASQMSSDSSTLTKNDFFKKYGHLRPGTYDVGSFRYDEAPEKYFGSLRGNPREHGKGKDKSSFRLMLEQKQRIAFLLRRNGIHCSVEGLFHFFRATIEGREYGKFVFSRSLSDAMKLLAGLGSRFGISREDVSYANIGIIKQFYEGSGDLENLYRRSIDEGKKSYQTTCQIVLPPLIRSAREIHSFELPVGEPNFITLGSVSGRVVTKKNLHHQLAGSILALPSADPGYDWIFSHRIVGLITQFGGVNSHMAIRANELGIPAVIGAGEVLFEKWSQAKRLAIDCANKRVQILE